MNYVEEIDFITGFSLIFDPTFDSTYNFNSFITRSSTCDPFVEVALRCQHGADDKSKYRWVSKWTFPLITFHGILIFQLFQNELKLKRNLSHPKVLIVNNKKIAIEEFHEAITALGFISIEKLHIHRLLDSEVSKLSYLVGDDLWNILMKIIACEELIEMVERKQGTYKRRVLKRTFENLTDKVSQILPKKLKLRDDIKTQLKLRNDFFALLHINQERLGEVFNFQVSNCQESILPIAEKLKRKITQNYQNESNYISNLQQRKNLQKFNRSLMQTRNMIEADFLKDFLVTPSSPSFDDFVKILDATKGDLDNFLISNLI